MEKCSNLIDTYLNELQTFPIRFCNGNHLLMVFHHAFSNIQYTLDDLRILQKNQKSEEFQSLWNNALQTYRGLVEDISLPKSEEIVTPTSIYTKIACHHLQITDVNDLKACISATLFLKSDDIILHECYSCFEHAPWIKKLTKIRTKILKTLRNWLEHEGQKEFLIVEESSYSTYILNRFVREILLFALPHMNNNVDASVSNSICNSLVYPLVLSLAADFKRYPSKNKTDNDNDTYQPNKNYTTNMHQNQDNIIDESNDSDDEESDDSDDIDRKMLNSYITDYDDTSDIEFKMIHDDTVEVITTLIRQINNSEEYITKNPVQILLKDYHYFVFAAQYYSYFNEKTYTTKNRAELAKDISGIFQGKSIIKSIEDVTKYYGESEIYEGTFGRSYKTKLSSMFMNLNLLSSIQGTTKNPSSDIIKGLNDQLTPIINDLQHICDIDPTNATFEKYVDLWLSIKGSIYVCNDSSPELLLNLKNLCGILEDEVFILNPRKCLTYLYKKICSDLSKKAIQTNSDQEVFKIPRMIYKLADSYHDKTKNRFYMQLIFAVGLSNILLRKISFFTTTDKILGFFNQTYAFNQKSTITKFSRNDWEYIAYKVGKIKPYGEILQLIANAPQYKTGNNELSDLYHHISNTKISRIISDSVQECCAGQ